MVFLRLPAVAATDDAPDPLPLNEQTALAFERALLAADVAVREQELSAAVADDRQLAAWLLALAERRTSRTVNRVDQAVAWLSRQLATELAAALVADPIEADPRSVEWRLPKLAVTLSANERQLAEFDRRLENEKLESLKELSYGASHEINNPLANIAARAQTLLEDETVPERRKKLIAIHRQAMRAHEMISDLMLFARPPKLSPESVDLDQLAQQVVGELKPLAEEIGVDLTYETPTEVVTLLVDRTQLGVAISAVVKNAVESAGRGGHVQVGLRTEQNWAEISIRDDGPGISEHVRRHMFDPFFSGREAGRGLGFGLSKCWRIITDHGGEVISPQCVAGAEFVLRLPLIQIAP